MTHRSAGCEGEVWAQVYHVIDCEHAINKTPTEEFWANFYKICLALYPEKKTYKWNTFIVASSAVIKLYFSNQHIKENKE